MGRVRSCHSAPDYGIIYEIEACGKKIKVPTTGLFDFPELILGGKGKYIDKTRLLYELASDADQQLFISRPRRFGKSLMLSTLKAMFEGRRELFKDLAIDTLPWEGWERPRPVLLFDMSRLSPSEGRDAMKIALAGQIRESAETFGVGPLDTGSIGFAFDELIRRVAATSSDGKVVVLVDEYDAPMTSVLDNLEYLRWMRSFLHDFYCRLKVNSGIIRFLMMTGVTKLTKLSIFSGLKHLKDRTMDPRFATLLGYTPEEMDGPLRDNIEVFAAQNGMSDWNEELADAQDDLIEKGVETLLKKNLKPAFAAVPHEWKINDEKEAKRYFLLFMKLIGSEISGERQSARGRADAILKDKSGVYVFEFKYGKTAEEALRQAREKDYAGPWLDGELPVFYVGVNYDPAKRGIDDPLVEPA